MLERDARLRAAATLLTRCRYVAEADEGHNLRIIDFEKDDSDIQVTFVCPPDDCLSLLEVSCTGDLAQQDWHRIATEVVNPNRTNVLVNVADIASAESQAMFFKGIGHQDSGDADGDGVPNGIEVILGTDPFSANSDGDLLADGDEVGRCDVLVGDDFLWFEMSDGRNLMNMAAHSGSLGMAITRELVVGGNPYTVAQMCRDGYVNFVPDFSWPESRLGPWSETNTLSGTDFSSGGVTVVPFGASLQGSPSVGGMFVGMVETNGVAYDVFEWHDMQLAGEDAAVGHGTFEVIVPLGEEDVFYVSYLELDDHFKSALPICGVQDVSRRSVFSTNSYYVINAPCMPQSRLTVRYEFGTNTDPVVDDQPWTCIGQCDEWVQLNYTNSEEIISEGYARWVDNAVGSGLTNGLYKLTVNLGSFDTPWAIVSVGDMSVTMTNAGECVFLLEKMREYTLEVTPFTTNVTWNAEDDILGGSPSRLMQVSQGSSGWSIDGGLSLIAPRWRQPGSCCWRPYFTVEPSVDHWYPAEGPRRYTAFFYDLCIAGPITYRWGAGSNDILIESPYGQSTEIQMQGSPSWRETVLYVTATAGGQTFTSSARLTYGESSSPQVHLGISAPDAVLKSGQGPSLDRLRRFSVDFSSDAPVNGTITLSCRSRGGFVALWSGLDKRRRLPYTQSWSVSEFVSQEGVVEGLETSSSIGDVEIKLQFIDEFGNVTEKISPLTVVEVAGVSLPDAPADGLVVLKNSLVRMSLDALPEGAANFMNVDWCTRRLRHDGTYTEWTLAAPGQVNASESIEVSEGGVYQVKAIARLQEATEEVYFLRSVDEDEAVGYYSAGDRDSFGVVDYNWQKLLRDSARQYLGQTSYAKSSFVSSDDRFTFVQFFKWKCNIFVAHRAREVGLDVPIQHIVSGRSYPPSANDWAGGTVVGWDVVPENDYPQPGYIIAHPNPSGSGHCGIVDYDGEGIAAGTSTVNRRYSGWADGTSVYRKLHQEGDENDMEN